jgi:hypothetical protein
VTGRSHGPPAAAILAVPLVVGLVLVLFAWPSARLEPRDLPIGVAGPPPAAAAIEQRLSAREGAFDLHRYPGEAAARQAIRDREVYGAFAVTPTGVQVLTASAASTAVAQLLQEAAAQIRAPGQSAPARVVDIVPAPRSSPALPSSVLPLVIAGLLAGVAAFNLAPNAVQRTGLVLAAAALCGLVGVAIVQGWLDVVSGGWLANAAVLALTVFAIGAALAGTWALLGVPGAIATALVMVVIGNPFSGVGSAPELLPEPAGTIGQLMPPGAGGNLLRSTGYFEGAGSTGHVIVLAAWAVAGLALLAVGSARNARPGPAD